MRTKPAKGVHVHGSIATNVFLEAGDMAVTFHSGCPHDGNMLVNCRPLIEHKATHSVAVLRFRPDHVEWLEQHLQCYDRSKELTFSVLGLQTKEVQDLVAASAYPASRNYLRVPINDHRFADFEMLEHRGIVKRFADEGATSTWQMTQVAVSHLQAMVTASAPERFLLKPRSLALEDLSRYELLNALKDNGFEWKHAPTKVEARRALAPFTPASTHKAFYCTGVKWDTQYALCLLRSPELFENGLLMVRHGEPPRYYKMALAGQSDGQESLALEDVKKTKKRQRLMDADVPMPLEDKIPELEDLPRGHAPDVEVDNTLALEDVVAEEPDVAEELASNDSDDGVAWYSTDATDTDDGGLTEATTKKHTHQQNKYKHGGAASTDGGLAPDGGNGDGDVSGNEDAGGDSGPVVCPGSNEIK